MITDINSLSEDTSATNASRRYRRSIGSTQIAKYAYNWWQTSFTLLTHFNHLSGKEMECGMLSEFGMEHNVSNFTGHLVKAIDGKQPHFVYRQYAKGLPAIVRKTGLKYRRPTATEASDHLQTTMRSRPVKYIFYFPNPTKARNVLLTNFPNLLALFTELDRNRR